MKPDESPIVIDLARAEPLRIGALEVRPATRELLLPPAAPAETRVAVLTFDVVGGQADARAFADGLADELIGTLNSDQIQALSRRDSDALRGPGRDEAMKRLGVGLIFDGAV